MDIKKYNKYNIISIIIISILILTNSGVLAVEDYINFISLEEQYGISQSTVQTIIQDSKGYLWFGSDDGLIKYDGYKIEKYRQSPFEENTLLDNYIIDLEEDKDGNIWIATNKGLTKLDNKNNEFKHYISNQKITAVFRDKKDELWIGTQENGLKMYNSKSDKFVSRKLKLSSPEITQITQDKDGQLLVGTKDGFDIVNTKTQEVLSYQYDEDNENTISGNDITAISQDSYGEIWVGTRNNGLNKINLDTDQVTRYLNDQTDSYSIGSNYITTIIEDRNKNIWIGSKQGGLARFDRDGSLFVKSLSYNKRTQSNKDNDILTLYQDRTGLIWRGTEFGGVSKFNPSTSFKNYTSEEAFENSMNDSNILSIYRDNQGIIWAGTKNGGVNKLNFEKRTVDYYTHKTNNKNTITSNTVNHIIEDSAGFMWFATDKGLSILNKKNDEITRYMDSEDEQGIAKNNINYILEDSYNQIWLATEDGLLSYNRENGELKNYNKENSNLNSNQITTLYEDINNDLWIGTFHDGLNKYNRKTGEVKSYKNNPKDKSTISNDQIKSIEQDNSGNIWIGTANGLNKLDKKTEKFKVFTEDNQFKTNYIADVVKYDNYLWISSSEGISKFNLKNETVEKTYSEIDGLQGSYFNAGSSYRSQDGQLLFGGADGFNTIYPDKEKPKKSIPNILLTLLSVNGEEIDIENKDKIVLSYDKNQLYFEYALIDYKNPSNNNHYYKLEGYDEEWKDSMKSNYGVYDNLKPGDYKLKIKGVNSEGVLTQNEIDIDILIKPPFWKTKWAYLIYFLAVILIVYLILNYVKFLEKIINDRTTQLNKTNRRLSKEVDQRKKTEEILKDTITENEKLFQEKMEVESFRNDFFINLSHELRTPLNIIISTIQLSEIYLDDEKTENLADKLKKHFENIKQNCYRLLNTVNNIIDVAKIESKQYQLNKKIVNIISLVEDVVMSTVSYGENKNVKITFDTETEEEIVKCDPLEIERVIMNLMSNAIKYSKEKGEIWVNIYVKDQYVEIEIKDDGIGIAKDKQEKIFGKFERADENTKSGSGVGLSLSKLLVDMHNGELELQSVEGQGSVFTVKLPLYEMKNGEYKENIDLEIETSQIRGEI